MAILLNELIKIQKQYDLTIKSGYIDMTFIINKKTQEKKNTSVEIKEEFSLVEYAEFIYVISIFWVLRNNGLIECECVIRTDKATLVLDYIEELDDYGFKLTEI